MYFSGVFSTPTRVTKLGTGEDIDFTYTADHRVEMRGLSVKEGEFVPVYKIEFAEPLVYKPFHKYPQIWL